MNSVFSLRSGFVRNGEFLAALGAPGGQYLATVGSRHSFAEPVLVDPFPPRGLKSPFHGEFILYFRFHPSVRQPAPPRLPSPPCFPHLAFLRLPSFTSSPSRSPALSPSSSAPRIARLWVANIQCFSFMQKLSGEFHGKIRSAPRKKREYGLSAAAPSRPCDRRFRFYPKRGKTAGQPGDQPLSGTEKANVAPLPSCDSNQSRPPFFSAKSTHSNSPSPDPSSLRVPALLKWVSGLSSLS